MNFKTTEEYVGKKEGLDGSMDWLLGGAEGEQ